jgi:hypothetical protein
MLAPCRLCGQLAELQESHILPAFVFKWLKETSATGFIRFGQEPNKRVQDGYKKPWLCLSCEKRLNVWETQFATNLFHPLNEDGGRRVRYREWLLKFCVSVSWRVLSMIREDAGLEHFTEEQRNAANQALETWSQFLFDKMPHPDRFEQHLLPLDAVEDYSGGDLPANINRYFLRTVDVDAVRGEKTTFVHSKIGKLIILGFIDVAFPKQWVGTKVHVREGVIGPGHYTLPKPFGDYLTDKALRFASLHEKISDNQRQKIEETARKNLDRVAHSASFEAMSHDVRLFGCEAFEIHQPKDER